MDDLERSFEFIGIPSGDHESFCWDVDYDTFVAIIGREPEYDDISVFRVNLYRVYPEDLIGYNIRQPMKFKFVITAVE